MTQPDQVEGMLHRWTGEQTALYAITTAAASLDPDRLLSTLLDISLPVAGADAGWVILFNSAPDKPSRIPVWRGVPDTFARDEVATLLLACPIYDSLLTGDSLPGKPHAFAELFAGCPGPLADEIASAGLREWIDIPLGVGYQLLGVLDLAWRGPSTYSEANHALLTTLGQQVGIALANAYLFQSEQRRMAKLQALYEASLRLNAQLETSDLLRLIVEQAVSLLGGEAGDLYTYDPLRGELTVSVAVGYFSEFIGVDSLIISLHGDSNHCIRQTMMGTV